MAWLIEAYIEEKSIDDKIKDTAKDGIQLSKRVARKIDNDNQGATMKELKKAAKEYRHDASANSTIKNAREHKYGKDSVVGNIKDYASAAAGNKETALKMANKFNDNLAAKDALDRHNRRHPDRAVGESGFLFEALLDEEMKTAADFRKKKEDEYLEKKGGELHDVGREVKVAHAAHFGSPNDRYKLTKAANHGGVQTASSVLRHNRRHPEAKLESVDLLVEILQ